MTGKRFLHTMLRVKDLDRSIAFYTDILGMKLIRKNEYPKGEFTLAFLGYGDGEENTLLELTYNWDNRDYEIGTGFGHLAVAVDDLKAAVKEMKEKGAKVLREPAEMNGGTTVIAFLEDPDGYQVELIAR
ncbi:lactoylglutathione lyase [bacterium]|nr:lactoylglutathione lyase [bacterium]